MPSTFEPPRRVKSNWGIHMIFDLTMNQPVVKKQGISGIGIGPSHGVSGLHELQAELIVLRTKFGCFPSLLIRLCLYLFYVFMLTRLF